MRYQIVVEVEAFEELDADQVWDTLETALDAVEILDVFVEMTDEPNEHDHA